LKKKIIVFSILTLMIIILGACRQQEEKMRLEIGSMPTLSASIYAVGVEKGFFEEENINVNLTIFKSAPERDAAATAGKLDGFMTDMMGLINLVDNGFDFKMTSVEYENFGIMQNMQTGKKVESSKFLGDKNSIGISENTVIEYLVDQLMDPSEVEKVNLIKIPDRLAAVLSNEIQLGVFPEPFVSIIKANGGKEIYSSANESIQPVVVVFSDELIEENKDSIKAFYEAYNKTVQYMKETSYDEYKEDLIKYGLINEDLVNLIKLPLDEFGPAKKPAEDDLNSVVEWMNSKEIINKNYKFKDLSFDILEE